MSDPESTHPATDRSAPTGGPSLFWPTNSAPAAELSITANSLEPGIWAEPAPAPRIPHLGHLLCLGVLLLLSLMAVGLITFYALHLHLFGVATVAAAQKEIHYMLGSMALLYLFTFLASLLFFPLLWQKSFFAGLQWNLSTAARLHRRLVFTALVCFSLAMCDGLIFHEPTDTPIDKIFRAPGAAWLLFIFGVTFAPFFEEIFFRGFLLPSLCTAYDWIGEKIASKPLHQPDPDGNPHWSVAAMVTGSILTSLPFALMHAEQTGWSVGPFILLVIVSGVLCAVRLVTRSLAASVLVHSSYNFMLFAIMLIGTGGFQHLDKM